MLAHLERQMPNLGPHYTEQQEYESAMHGCRQTQQTQQEQETMKIGTMIGSKYLKKDDCDPPLLLTIERFEEENVAPDDKPAEMKWVMYFSNSEKGLVMNTTNLQLAAIACKSQDTDDWLGQQIVAFNDPAVSYAGKVTGGVRLRAPRKAPGAKSSAKTPDPRPDPPPLEDMDSDVPF